MFSKTVHSPAASSIRRRSLSPGHLALICTVKSFVSRGIWYHLILSQHVQTCTCDTIRTGQLPETDKYLFTAPVRPMSFLCVLRWNRWTSLWPVGSSIVCTYCYCSLKSLKSMAGLQTTHNHTLVVMNKDAIWFLHRGSPPNSWVHW